MSIRNSDGNTALMLATSNLGFSETTKLLRHVHASLASRV